MMISIWIVIAATLATLLTRFLPLFLNRVFQKSKWFLYLSKVLPLASFGLLVVYSIQNVSIIVSPYGLPEHICIAVVVFIQVKTDKIIYSIFCGSFLYILIVNFII